MSDRVTAVQTGWEERFRTQIRGVDDDHFILFSLISDLQVAVVEGGSRAATSALLDNLVSYVRIHFGREEDLLRSHHYPELEAHIAEHDGFARKVLEYQADFQQGSLGLSQELLSYLKKWLIQHILVVDQKYVEYLRNRGVK